MANIRDFLLLAQTILPSVGLVLFFWGVIDNYFLTRYGGRINRGFTIWTQPLKTDERQFLNNLKDDIVDIKERHFGLRTGIKRDFVMVDSRKVLIRFNHMGQRTSWPLVGYVDLSLPEPQMEYRLSLPMLVGTIFIMLLNMIIAIILLLAFVFSWLFETGGLRKYISQKTDLYLSKQDSKI